MEEIGNKYIAFTPGNLLPMVQEAERLNKGNGLEFYLKDHGFRQQGPSLFSHHQPLQLIVLTPGARGISYNNLLDENDRGDFIQFLRNRFLEVGKIIPNEKIHTFLAAVRVAQEHEKARETKTLAKRNLKGKRRGKGL